ncbi:MAG: hypothetical protein CTY20_00050 [Hyphomicrobium sp.]|nr:MAG: hypothetical protein CTY20_00050 [Hyphomicrobium sp.]
MTANAWQAALAAVGRGPCAEMAHSAPAAAGLAGKEHVAVAANASARAYASVQRLAIGAFLAEVLLAIAHVGFGAGFVVTALGHLVIVAACSGWLLSVPSGRPLGGATAHDMVPGAMVVAATTVAGPIGALFALAIPTFLARPMTPSPLLDAWYQRIAQSGEIDPETRLCDNVSSGRTMDLAAPPPQSFVEVMSHGGLADKQSALGLIARRFHPDYLPALAVALKSPEPVVRVQAAAVAARVRNGLKSRVRALLDEVDAAVVSPQVAACRPELAKAVASGLLDASDRVRAEAALARFADGLASSAASSSAVAPGGPSETVRAVQSFKALRVSRRVRLIEASGRYVVRDWALRVRGSSARSGAPLSRPDLSPEVNL